MSGKDRKRRGRSLEGTEILCRDLRSARFGEKFVYVARRNGPLCPRAVRNPKKPLASKLGELAHDRRKEGIAQLSLNVLAALALEREDKHIAFHPDVILQQGRRASASVGARVFFVPRAQERAIDQPDHCGGDLLPAQAGRSEGFPDRAPDLWQGRAQSPQPGSFGERAGLLPFGMVAVLQPSFGIAADGLNMSPLVSRDIHVGPARRDGKPLHATLE